MKVCPFCGEEVQDEAVKCKHCSSDLSTKEAKEKMQTQKRSLEQNNLLSEITLRAKDFPKNTVNYLKKNPTFFKKIQSKSDLEIIQIVGEKIRKSQILFIYIGGIIAMIIGLGSDNIVLKILSFGLIFAIWFHPEKNKDLIADFKPRLTNFKAYPVRIFFTSILGLIVCLTLWADYGVKQEKELKQNQENQRLAEEQRKVEEDKKLYSIPSIVIKSSQGLQTTPAYTLIFSASGADTITVNGESLTGSGGEYSKVIQMSAPLITLNIEGKNKYYSKMETITVSRAKTGNELQAEKAAQELQAKNEADRIAKERAEVLRVEKAAKDKERLRAQLIQKYERVVKTGGYLYEIEKKLGDMEFYQLDSGFSKSQDGSTQVYTIYKKEDQGHTVYIFLQSAYALGKYWYKVTLDTPPSP